MEISRATLPDGTTRDVKTKTNDKTKTKIKRKKKMHIKPSTKRHWLQTRRLATQRMSTEEEEAEHFRHGCDRWKIRFKLQTRLKLLPLVRTTWTRETHESNTYQRREREQRKEREGSETLRISESKHSNDSELINDGEEKEPRSGRQARNDSEEREERGNASPRMPKMI